MASYAYDGFLPEKGRIAEQIEAIIELGKTYYFTQADHFDLVMESFGVKVTRAVYEGQEQMVFQGLDPKTHEPCTPILPLPET